MWWPKAFHCFSEEFQRCFAVTALCDIAFQHFAFMINGTPKVMPFAIDLHKNFVQMPLPVRICTHPVDPVSSDFRGKHRPKAIPPEPHRFVADVDADLVQQILDVSE